MPLYEFYCPPCGVQFEVLRPMRRAEEPATCPSGHVTADRVISLFATVRKDEDGQSQPTSVSGCACGGACACGGH